MALLTMFGLLWWLATAEAGSLEPPAPPDDAASAMYTLEDIYHRLASGAVVALPQTGFSNPTTGPVAERHTLNEIMAIAPQMDNERGVSPAYVVCGKRFWGLRTDGSWGAQVGVAGCERPTARFSLTPEAGDTATPFQWDASASSDPQDDVTLLQVRWDWEGDGQWDTAYTDDKQAEHLFEMPGTYEVQMEVRDSDQLTHTTTRTVSVAEQELPVEEASYTHEIGMVFLRLPEGLFAMGCEGVQEGSATPPCGAYGERPQHDVALNPPLYMQTTEVTQGQWQAVMGDNPSGFAACGADCPVENVSWHDVQAFLSALNGADGANLGSYRLPTEAEWEYAARAGTTIAYAFGDDPAALGAYAWYKENALAATHPVATRQPNAWGLYDMHGNVSEWVQDVYSPVAYRTHAATDPLYDETGFFRVTRGGYWFSHAYNVRSANRGLFAPGVRFSGIGFRMVFVPQAP